jgi:hypothetical protein
MELDDEDINTLIAVRAPRDDANPQVVAEPDRRASGAIELNLGA